MASSVGLSDEPSPSLETLEVRISRIEQHLGLAPLVSAPQTIETAESFTAQEEGDQKESELEASFGEFGLAWVGSIVFFLGVVFLITYTSNLGYKLLSTF